MNLIFVTLFCLIALSLSNPANCGSGARGNVLDISALEASDLDTKDAYDCARKNICTYKCPCGKVQHFELVSQVDVDAYLAKCMDGKRKQLVDYVKGAVGGIQAQARALVSADRLQIALDAIADANDKLSTQKWTGSIRHICSESQSGVKVTTQNILQTIFNITDTEYKARFAPITDGTNQILQGQIDLMVQGFLNGVIPIYSVDCACEDIYVGDSYKNIAAQGCATTCAIGSSGSVSGSGSVSATGSVSGSSSGSVSGSGTGSALASGSASGTGSASGSQSIAPPVKGVDQIQAPVLPAVLPVKPVEPIKVPVASGSGTASGSSSASNAPKPVPVQPPKPVQPVKAPPKTPKPKKTAPKAPKPKKTPKGKKTGKKSHKGKKFGKKSHKGKRHGRKARKSIKKRGKRSTRRSRRNRRGKKSHRKSNRKLRKNRRHRHGKKSARRSSGAWAWKYFSYADKVWGPDTEEFFLGDAFDATPYDSKNKH